MNARTKLRLDSKAILGYKEGMKKSISDSAISKAASILGQRKDGVKEEYSRKKRESSRRNLEIARKKRWKK